MYAAILNDTMARNGIKYEMGVNEDLEFNGVLLVKYDEWYKLLNCGEYVVTVDLAIGGTLKEVLEGFYRADKIIVSNIVPVNSHHMWDNPEFCERAVKAHACAIMYTDNNQTLKDVQQIHHSGWEMKVNKDTGEISMICHD